MTHVLGIDYASIDDNSPPRLDEVVAAAIRFVFVRASLGTWHDPIPLRDHTAIRAAGLVYGAYIGPDISAAAPSPEAQVEAFKAAAQLVPNVDFAPVIDIELSKGIAGSGMSRPQIADWIGKLIAAVTAEFGCKPILYTSKRVLEDSDTDTLAGAADNAVADCPLWLAYYPFKTKADAHLSVADTLMPPPVPAKLGDADGWWLHQYQGDAQKVPGISVQADINRFNPATATTMGTRRAWIAARLGAAAAISNADLETALREFQRGHNLQDDGLVGPKTFAALSWQP